MFMVATYRHIYAHHLHTYQKKLAMYTYVFMYYLTMGGYHFRQLAELRTQAAYSFMYHDII